jgi:hypothetical protein
MDRYREYPVIGETIFCEPKGGAYAWTFVGISTLYTLWMVVDRGVKVGLLAGGGLLLLSVPNVLPRRYHRLSVVVRVVGIVYYVGLWVVILTVFPDAPTFFEGNW